MCKIIGIYKKIFNDTNFTYLTKIKNWDYIFYFDINMSIHHDINQF